MGLKVTVVDVGASASASASAAMTNVQTFMFALPAGTATMQVPVRTLEINGAPWFVAKDVCRCLGLNNTTKALLALDGAEKGLNRVHTPGGAQTLNTLSESGLYKLVMRSDKPEARKFQDWVTRDVLPAIRKDGGYIMGVKGRLLGALRDSLQRPNHRRHQCGHAHAKGLQRLAYGLPDESLTTTTTL